MECIMLLSLLKSCPITPKPTHSKQGFSLIEFMIALSVVAILLFTALPSFDYWRAKTESQLIAYTLYAQLQTARELAISRGATISICGSNANGECQLRNFDYLQIFIDTNKNKIRDKEELLISSTALKMTGQLRLNNHTSLQLKSNGSSNTPASFIYCPANTAEQLIQRVTLSFTGRPYIGQPNTKGMVENASGSAISCTNWQT